MQDHAGKNLESRSRTIANQSLREKEGSEAAFQFVDNRPEALQLRKLQEMANNSPQGKESARLQSMIDKSPRMVVQRQQLAGPVSKAAQREDQQEAEEFQMEVQPAPVQRQVIEEEELLPSRVEPVKQNPNRTGMPDQLKAGVENLSGMSMDDVKVHYNSAKPATVQALAYTQGSDIHVAPGQEKHLAHETWHVVQQKQGRVSPTVQMAGANINDDRKLEQEADAMGLKAVQMKALEASETEGRENNSKTIQRLAGKEYETGIEARDKTAPASSPPSEHDGRIDQDATIYTSGQGWQIDSDNSKLEFVTYPAVALNALPAVMVNMLNFIDTGTFPVTARQSMNTTFNNPGPSVDAKYDILPYAKGTVTGSPQGTIGIPFSKVGQFFKVLSHLQLNASNEVLKEHQTKLTAIYKASAQAGTQVADKTRNDQLRASVKQEETSGQAAVRKSVGASIAQADAAINKVTGDLVGQAGLDELKGIMHFIAHYISKAQTKVTGYKKKRFAMLARTSFSVMYQKLNPTMQGKFLTKTNAMINEIGFDKSLLLFPESKNPFTIDQWLTTIENPGNINLPDKKGAYDKTVTSDLMTAPNAFVDNSPTDVSMGLFNTNDPFNDLIVIELRTLKHFAEVGTFTTKTMRELAKDLQIIYTASTL